jgi:hypothetical protein
MAGMLYKVHGCGCRVGVVALVVVLRCIHSITVCVNVCVRSCVLHAHVLRGSGTGALLSDCLGGRTATLCRILLDWAFSDVKSLHILQFCIGSAWESLVLE